MTSIYFDTLATVSDYAVAINNQIFINGPVLGSPIASIFVVGHGNVVVGNVAVYDAGGWLGRFVAMAPSSSDCIGDDNIAVGFVGSFGLGVYDDQGTNNNMMTGVNNTSNKVL
jgi:hypothetical protein